MMRVMALLMACVFALPVSAVMFGALREFFTRPVVVETQAETLETLRGMGRKQSGVTLIELLAVLGILGTVALWLGVLYVIYHFIAKFW